MKPIITSAMGLFALTSFATAGEKKDIVDTAVSAGNFTTLVAAVKAAGLVDALKGEGPFTVFAPTDEAFAKLPKGTVETLLKPENKDKLIDILTYHVVPAKVPFEAAVGLEKATALNEETIKISVKSGRLILNDSKVIENDIETSNGIIHVIDSVLLPPAKNEQATTSPAEKLMMAAIDKGVPVFNHGQHGACADIYEITAQAVVMMPNTSCGDKKVLMTALSKASKTNCDTTRAWTMRKAIDQVMASAH